MGVVIIIIYAIVKYGESQPYAVFNRRSTLIITRSYEYSLEVQLDVRDSITYAIVKYGDQHFTLITRSYEYSLEVQLDVRDSKFQGGAAYWRNTR